MSRSPAVLFWNWEPCKYILIWKEEKEEIKSAYYKVGLYVSEEFIYITFICTVWCFASVIKTMIDNCVLGFVISGMHIEPGLDIV